MYTCVCVCIDQVAIDDDVVGVKWQGNSPLAKQKCYECK